MHALAPYYASWRSACALLCVALLTACSTLVSTPGADALEPADRPTSLSAQQAQAAWARVLATHVNERGLVDFAALARAPEDLHAYVRYIAQLRPESLTDKDERLAHLLNAYNALSMFNVLDLGIPASNAGWLSRYRFFISRQHVIGGQRLSLYAYENEVIRKIGEPRVHWALNCSALSCPVLPREPFTGPLLEAQLEREARAFFAQERNLRVDHAKRTVYLSEIFSFFPEDFVPHAAPSLIAYASRYAPQPLDTSYQVRFIPYDWTIANWQR
jgi:Protein of unknown function, DUF547